MPIKRSRRESSRPDPIEGESEESVIGEVTQEPTDEELAAIEIFRRNPKLLNWIPEKDIVTGMAQEVLDSIESAINSRKKECTCAEDDLPHDTRTPAMKAGRRTFNTGKKNARIKIEEKEKKVEATSKILLRMMIGCLFNVKGAIDMESIKKAQDEDILLKIEELAEEIAEEITSHKAVKIQDIINAIVRNKRRLGSIGITIDIIENDQEGLEDLINLHDARKPIKAYLQKLIFDASDLKELKLAHIWREKAFANGSDNERAEIAREEIDNIGKTANRYCATFFKPYSLNQEIQEINDLFKLQEIQKTLTPVDEDSHSKLVSAIAKINMMHLIDAIRSQVDSNQMRVVSQHLDKLLKIRTIKKKHRTYFTCANPNEANDKNSLRVESINVASEKTEEAAARKFMDKDSENTKSFDVSNIKDWIRFGIDLTKEDSSDEPDPKDMARIKKEIEEKKIHIKYLEEYNPEQLDEEKNKLEKLGKKEPLTIAEAATLKALRIICALLGTDIPDDRIRHALTSGSTNENSTGKHEAFHLTIRYRHQCSAVKSKTIPVEIQIRKYMNSQEQADDVADYVARKDKKNTRIAGMDVSFYAFVTDLCDYILNDEELNEDDEDEDNQFRKRSEMEEMVFLLLLILTKKNKDKDLQNEAVVRQIYNSDVQRQKVEKVIEKYKKHIAHIHESKTQRMVHVPTSISKLSRKLEETFKEMGEAA